MGNWFKSIFSRKPKEILTVINTSNVNVGSFQFYNKDTKVIVFNKIDQTFVLGSIEHIRLYTDKKEVSYTIKYGLGPDPNPHHQRKLFNIYHSEIISVENATAIMMNHMTN